MADLAFTAAKVRNASPVGQSVELNMIATVAITAGQAVYPDTSGGASLADASAAGTAICCGIALETVAIGQAVAVLYQGFVEGFTITQAYGLLIFVSDTAGDLEDAAAGTVAAPVGRVLGATDPDKTKLLYIDCSTNMTVLPA